MKNAGTGLARLRLYGYAIALAATTTVTATVSGQAPAVSSKSVAKTSTQFPAELLEWTFRSGNPVFTAEGPGHWEVKIRERGWILREGPVWHLWYTGYDGTREGLKRLGYAASPDGIHWTRSKKNPLSGEPWVEDMMVVKCGNTYFMFAEGSENQFSVMLTSKDGIDWRWEGRLDVRMADGMRPVEEPVGTPTVWIEDGKWLLFYERLDKGVWLARTDDVCSKVWTNVRDVPVLAPGPAAYDSEMIALNQIVRYKGAYYAFYHGSGDAMSPRTWNTNIARSVDLIHWEKFSGNPLIEDNKSSGIVVPVGRGYRLYTMHDRVDVFEQRARD